jgi:ABC-2 type transport system ATP-binding protein
VTSLDGAVLDLAAERSQVNVIMAACPTWGELVDVEITDADLDDVMRTVLAGS